MVNEIIATKYNSNNNNTTTTINNNNNNNNNSNSFAIDHLQYYLENIKRGDYLKDGIIDLKEQSIVAMQLACKNAIPWFGKVQHISTTHVQLL